jgi:hypothetical protein
MKLTIGERWHRDERGGETFIVEGLVAIDGQIAKGQTVLPKGPDSGIQGRLQFDFTGNTHRHTIRLSELVEDFDRQ